MDTILFAISMGIAFGIGSFLGWYLANSLKSWWADVSSLGDISLRFDEDDAV